MSAAPALLSLKDVTFIKSNGGRGLAPARAMSSDISSSGDEFHIKVRKPYTITKQREKWTEHEHQKFLEALKLYGRSWRHIKEHIGTKTAVQIRSHAQKFFFKVEREASNNGLTGQVQEIEIPPPRPKRKPSRPYPRKAGSSLPLPVEHGDTFTNCCSAAVNPASFSSSTDNEGLALKANTQHENAPGSYEVGGLAENTKPLDEVSDKVVLHNDCQQAGIPPDNNAIPCTERNFLVQPQMGVYNDGEGSATEASNSADEMSMILPAARCEAKVSMSEAEVHPESQSGYIHPNKGEGRVCTSLNLYLETSPCAEVSTSRQSSYHEGSNSNPAGMWINYYGRRDPQTPSHGPTHELHPAFPTSPWQFMQASLMNHSAAFAAAMAAAAWTMGGTGSASPYTCKGYYGVQPSPEDINAAAFAAVSASWWAMSGFVPNPLGHQRHHPYTGATLNHLHVPSATGNTPQHEMSANPTPVEDEVPVFSTIPAQGYKANKKILSGPNMSAETLASDICVQGSNESSNTRKNPSTLADELDGGDWRTQEGSSSGSNTPPLTAHSGEQDTPSPSDNDNENLSLCICVDDTHNGPLCEGECVRMKFKNMERGRHHQKQLRYGESESGKKFKGSIHDMDSRKEVSLQGRKAFEALFTCRTLPQTFRKAIGKDEAQREKAKWQQIVSVPVTDSNSCHLEGIALHETDGSIECAMITEDDEPNTNCFKEFSTKSDVDMYGPCTSRNSKSRGRTSGFTPYKKPSAERRASSYSAVGLSRSK